MKYLFGRLGFTVVAGWVSVTLAFILPRLIPGDPGTVLLARFRGKLAPSAVEALRGVFGIGQEPLAKQYFGYLGRIARGDLGISISHFPSPVRDVIGEALGWTLLLGGVSLVLSFLLGTGLGVLAAWRRGGRLDAVLPATLTLLATLPYFWVAMLVLYFFGFNRGWFPVRHAYGDGLVPGFNFAFLGSVIAHAVLPAATIVVATLGTWLLAMRNTVVGVLGEDFIVFARGKGLGAGRLVWAYAARNALLPNITSFGMALGFVVSGALLTEVVFAYPGQGYLLVGAVASLDYPLIQGVYLTITLAVLGANLLLDIVNVWLDPRLRRSS